jgi:hypothetical protein
VVSDGIVVPYIKISPDQRRFFNLDCNIQGFAACRGAGKTKIGCLKVLYSAKDRNPWMIVAPDSRDIEYTMWPCFEETARKLGVWIRGVRSPVRRAWIRTFDGGETNIVFRGAENPQSLRGPSKAGIWIDDASDVSLEVYRYSMPSLRCMTEDGVSVGPMLLTFTPKPPAVNPETKEIEPHWLFYVFYDIVCDAGDGDSASSHVANGEVLYCGKWWLPGRGTGLVKASTKDNPFLPKEFADKLRSQYPAHLAASQVDGE